MVGDPDLFVSNETKTPTKEDHTWSSAREGADLVEIHADDPGFARGDYYIGVLGADAGGAVAIQFKVWFATQARVTLTLTLP